MKESVASERYNYLHLHVDLLNDPPGSPEFPLLFSACPSAIHMNVFFCALETSGFVEDSRAAWPDNSYGCTEALPPEI